MRASHHDGESFRRLDRQRHLVHVARARLLRNGGQYEGAGKISVVCRDISCNPAIAQARLADLREHRRYPPRPSVAGGGCFCCGKRRASGKKPKVVIVAVMRKMITALNAMVRDDVAWADRLSGRHSVATTR
jgi:hypothetical protein